MARRRHEERRAGRDSGPLAELKAGACWSLNAEAEVESDWRESWALRLVRFHFTYTLFNAFRKWKGGLPHF